MRTLAVFLFFALAAIAEAGTANSWDEWKAELHQQCPSRHVEWISGGGYDEILADFAKTLPAAMNRKIYASADFSDRCAFETAGFGCEMATSLGAFSKLGLMRRFAAFGCREYKCDEPSLCTKTQGASSTDLKQRTGGWWEHGKETCATWLEARDAQGADELIYRAWVDGYLAGVRRGEGKGPNGPQVASGMDTYCRAHRAAPLMDAVKKLKL